MIKQQVDNQQSIINLGPSTHKEGWIATSSSEVIMVGRSSD